MAVVLQGRTARRLAWATVASIVLSASVIYALLVTGPTYMAVREMRAYAGSLLVNPAPAGCSGEQMQLECIRERLRPKAYDLGIDLEPDRVLWDGETLVLQYTRKADFLFFRHDWRIQEWIRLRDVREGRSTDQPSSSSGG